MAGTAAGNSAPPPPRKSPLVRVDLLVIGKAGGHSVRHGAESAIRTAVEIRCPKALPEPSPWKVNARGRPS